jgi:hypothetical protein
MFLMASLGFPALLRSVRSARAVIHPRHKSRYLENPTLYFSPREYGDYFFDDFPRTRPEPLVAPALRNRLHDIVSGDHDGWFSTTLGAKAVRLAEDLARSHGVLLPLADAVKRRFEEAAAQGWADADIGAVVELLRRHT